MNAQPLSLKRSVPFVFRVQEPPPRVEGVRDYTSCAGFGRMKTILDHQQNPSVDPDHCYRLIYEALQHAQSGDYLLWSGGDPMSAFLAGKALGELGIQGIRWLRWDKRTDSSGLRTRYGYYTPVTF